MIIPKFYLSQDDNFVTIVIVTPYVKISKAYFYVTSDSFKFHL